MSTFSIIVPVYNTGDYLRSCLDSVLSQSFTDFELLLIDDGSTDGSSAICDEYAAKDSRVVVFHKRNEGVSSARNLGLDNAHGEWVVFCDSDDIVLKHWLSCFDGLKNDESDVLCQGIEFNTLRRGEHNVINRGIDFSGNMKNAVEALYENDVLGYLVSKAFRRQTIEDNRLRFQQAFNYHEDEDFFLRYALVCRGMTSVAVPGYVYFEPDWRKYTKRIQNRYQLFKSKWEAIYKLYGDVSYKVAMSYLNDYSYNFLLSAEECDNIAKLRLLCRDYSNTVCGNALKSGLFYPTRLLLHFDKTGWASALCLRAHIWIKNIINS